MKEASRPVRREGPQHRCQDAFIRRARAATFPVNGEGDDTASRGSGGSRSGDGRAYRSRQRRSGVCRGRRRRNDRARERRHRGEELEHEGRSALRAGAVAGRRAAAIRLGMVAAPLRRRRGVIAVMRRRRHRIHRGRAMLRCGCRHSDGGMAALERHARRGRRRADPVQDQQQGEDEAHGDGHGAQDTASASPGLESPPRAAGQAGPPPQ